MSATRTLRPGRTYCAAVESYDCEAPAGYSSGLGTAGAPGVHRDDLAACGYCGERVCEPCSTEMTPPAFLRKRGPVRVCNTHEPDELADWLGLTGTHPRAQEKS